MKKNLSIDMRKLRKAAMLAAGSRVTDPECMNLTPELEAAFKTLGQVSEQLSEVMDLLAKAGWLSINFCLTGMAEWVQNMMQDEHYQDMLKDNQKKDPDTKHILVAVDANGAWANGALNITLPSASRLEANTISTSAHDDAGYCD